MQFINHTFEDIELHVSRNTLVGFLGALLEEPHFGRPGPLRLLVLPGLPGSLQAATTMLALGLLDAEQATALLSARGGGGALPDEDGVVRVPLPGRQPEDFTAAHFVQLARLRLGLGPDADLGDTSQRELEEHVLWQAADELRRYRRHSACGASFSVVGRRGAVINLLHGYATNYYHFVTEQVPALLAARSEVSWLPQDLVTLLYLGSAWQAEFARLAGFSEDQLLHYDPCKVYRADLVYTAAVPDSKAAELLLQTRDMVVASGYGGEAAVVDDAVASSLRCYGPKAEGPVVRVLVIERRCVPEASGACGGEAAARGRSISNYDEVLEAIRTALPEQDGFALCSFRAEEHTVASQAQHFEAADLVIGAIGAGLTNILFMRPGGMVVSLHPAHPEASFSVYSSRCGQSYFWHMAAQLGIEYWAFLCPEMTVFEGGRVDAGDLERLLRSKARPWLLSGGAGGGAGDPHGHPRGPKTMW